MSYYGILTPAGLAKQANALSLGSSIKITELAVCHGNGADLSPPDLLGGLIGQWRRAPLNQLSVDPQNPAYLIAEQVIPPDVGGHYIRGMGLYDEDGDLIAVANCPTTYKPLLSEGAGRTQVIRMVIMVGSTDSFTLKIDPAVVLATRQYVDEGLAGIAWGNLAGVPTEFAPTAHDHTISNVTGLQAALNKKLNTTGGTLTGDLTVSSFVIAKAGTSKNPVLFLRDAKGNNRANVHWSRDTTTVNLVRYDPATGASAGWLRINADNTIQTSHAIKDANLSGNARAPTRPATDNSTKIATTAHVKAAIAASAIKVFSITSLPTTDVGPIIVAEVGEVWLWVSTTHYTGYRSPLCGRPLDGHTLAPLPSEIDAVGGLVSKTSYARLWAYAQENNLVVSDEDWTANIGAHWFVDVSATQFRVPDLRNQFRRYTGTDADNADARALGSWQKGSIAAIDKAVAGIWGISHSTTSAATARADLGYDGGDTTRYSAGRLAAASASVVTGITGNNEATYGFVRPQNTAFHPRIHI